MSLSSLLYKKNENDYRSNINIRDNFVSINYYYTRNIKELYSDIRYYLRKNLCNDPQYYKIIPIDEMSDQ